MPDYKLLDKNCFNQRLIPDPQSSIITLRLRNNQSINLSKPAGMGVINMSPNSFYNPVKNIEAGLHVAEQMIHDGVDIIDIGGEATNPFVDLEIEKPNIDEEINRVAPLITAIRKRFDVLLSVDTSQPQVMQAAIEHGADMINDQRSLQVKGALEAVSQLKVPVCLMHFFTPLREPESCSFEELFTSIKADLQASVQRCLNNGIHQDRIIIDVGFGGGNYGKNTPENYYLLSRLSEFVALGYPVLTGWSRKTMIGDTLGVSTDKRLHGSIAAATIAALNGAAILRVHDVKETVDAVKVAMMYEKFKIES